MGKLLIKIDFIQLGKIISDKSIVKYKNIITKSKNNAFELN